MADDPVDVNPFWCRGGGIDLNCANDEVDAVGSLSLDDFFGKVGRAFLLAFWIHFAFFVAEVAMLVANPDPGRRRVVDGFAHVLVMPLTILSFYNSDTMGQLLFFAALWHFFSDTSATRPTYALLVPGFGGRTWGRQRMIVSHLHRAAELVSRSGVTRFDSFMCGHLRDHLS